LSAVVLGGLKGAILCPTYWGQVMMVMVESEGFDENGLGSFV
jgi:hypothetical protein